MNEEIGRGARARVYAQGDCAVKRFEAGYPKERLLYEAYITALVEQTGIPIAAVLSVDCGDFMELRLRRVRGNALYAGLEAEPHTAPERLRTLVALQRRIHAQHIWLPSQQKARIDGALDRASLEAPLLRALRASLARLPEDDCLCHGDFHGWNVLGAPGEWRVIDWMDATRGCPEGDACRSYLLHSLANPELAELYLSIYCAQTGCERQRVLEWLPVLAAARLAEGQPGERSRLLEWARRALD